MKIVHLSDLHITKDGVEIWGTNTLSHFQQAIDVISQIDDIDAIIVTGDLSNDGSNWSYTYIHNCLKKLGVPVFCCPGNHDNLENMQFVNSEFFHISDYHFNIDGYDLFVMNSTISGMSRGLLCEDSMSWLDEKLSNSCNPAIIAFHHPAVDPGGWLNRKLLDNKEEFVKLVSRYSHVKLVLYGHIHYYIQQLVNDIIFCAAPAIGFAFDKELPKFQIAKGQEGFSVITISRDNEINIEKISLSEKSLTKNMVIKITDSELLKSTGGIVQGMSGSPIIQDGKLVGAVTHVFVNDPTKGYGIFAENMYSVSCKAK